jgi:hypothetical protein
VDHLSADADAGHDDDARDALMGSQEMMGLRKGWRHLTGHKWLRLLLIALSLSTLTQIVHADGGVVLWQRTTGPFTITLFSTEMPLRPGPADISLLLERTGGNVPVMDAQVFIELQHEAGTIINAEATRSQARNKLLYCSLINLPAAGQWKLRLNVSRGYERAEVLGDLAVARPLPVLLSYWKLISFPPIIMILFIINQWLTRSRSRRHDEYA